MKFISQQIHSMMKYTYKPTDRYNPGLGQYIMLNKISLGIGKNKEKKLLQTCRTREEVCCYLDRKE